MKRHLEQLYAQEQDEEQEGRNKRRRRINSRFWRFLACKLSDTQHVLCERHTKYKRKGYLTDRSNFNLRPRPHCWGCSSRSQVRTMRYDLRDRKWQDLPNKEGVSKIVINDRFKVLTIQGLCQPCMDQIITDLGIVQPPHPTDYFPCLPTTMPTDLKHMVRQYLETGPAEVSLCYYCYM